MFTTYSVTLAPMNSIAASVNWDEQARGNRDSGSGAADLFEWRLVLEALPESPLFTDRSGV